MSGAVRTVGKIAGVVAFVASAAVTFGATAVAGVALSTIAGVAGAVATVSSVVAGPPKPTRQGSVQQTTIGTDQPSCEIYGRTYSPGARIHLIGYGATRKKVKNPYLLAVDVHSVGGPVDALEQIYTDFNAVNFAAGAGSTNASGYFNDFLYRSAQLGQQSEASALALQWAGAPGWGADAKLSGKAAIAFNALFDKDGDIFASGFPQMGSVWRGVKAYDPAKDSTYPGGSGAHRWASPTDTAAFDAARATWEYTTNPGLLALRYALGSWERDVPTSGSKYRRVFGMGLPIDSVIVADFVTLRNVCVANGWAAGGRLFEPGDRWDNIKRVLAAAAARPCWRGGRLALDINTPRVAVDTITADDLAGDGVTICAMQEWEQRLNTIVAKYRSENHKWEMVSAGEVQVAAHVTADGEEKRDERTYEFVQAANQGKQLAAYELMDRREVGPITITTKPRLRRYGPGDLLILDIPGEGLAALPAVIQTKSFDPASMLVTFTLRGETTGKHAFALGQTGTAPPAPTIVSTAALDGAAGTATDTRNIIYRQATDPAALNDLFDGDLWVDTGVTPNVLRIRVGTAWQVAANLTTQGSDVGVANGATRNQVFRQATAPTSPQDGDVWVDTGVTPNVLRTRVSGAWSAGANLVLQGSDIGVDNAATAGNNRIPQQSGWAAPAGWTFVKPATTLRVDWAWRWTSGTAFAYSGYNSPPKTATDGAKRLWVQFMVKGSTTSTGFSAPQLYFYNGGSIVGSAVAIVPGSDIYATGSEQYYLKVVDVPAGATSFQIEPRVFADPGAAGRTVDIAIVVTTSEPAADVTINAAPVVQLTSNSFEVPCDAAGTVISGTEPVIWPKVLRNNVPITASDDVTYAVAKPSDLTSGGDGGTVTIDNTNGSATKGKVSYSFASGSNAITFLLTVKVSGNRFFYDTIRVTKKLATAASGGGSGSGGGGSGTGTNPKSAEGPLDQATSATSYSSATSNGAVKVTIASGDKLKFATTNATVNATSGTGSRNGILGVEYATSSAMTSPTDFPGGTASAACFPGSTTTDPETGQPVWNDGSPGSITMARDVTGLSAGDYWVRPKLASGTSGKGVALAGDYTVKAEP